MKIFIEFWKAKEAWHQLPKDKRNAFMAQIGPVMEDLISKGLVIDTWGANTDTTPQKADFDFFAITKLPTQDLLDTFQIIIEEAGWYDYFEQTNVSGNDLGVEAVIGKMIEM